MKIAICGSIFFMEEMIKGKQILELFGHEVQTPPLEVKNEHGEMIPVGEYYQKRKAANDRDEWIWERKQEAILTHFDKIAWSDVVLIANHDKNNVVGYIGGNTLMEMGVALYLKKPIYLVRPIPELPYREEILAMKPIVMSQGDLTYFKPKEAS